MSPSKKRQEAVQEDFFSLLSREDKAVKEESTSVMVPLEPYTVHLWKGSVTVYKCTACGTFISNEGDMILHVAQHSLTPSEALDKLMKEK